MERKNNMGSKIHLKSGTEIDVDQDIDMLKKALLLTKNQRGSISSNLLNTMFMMLTSKNKQLLVRVTEIEYFLDKSEMIQ